MKKELKESLPNWITCACVRCCYSKYYNVSKQDFDDAFISAYVGIMDGIKADNNLKNIDFDCKNLSKDIYLKLLHYGRLGVRKYYFGGKYGILIKECSFDKPILENEKKSKTFGETIPFEDIYNFDYEIVENLLQKELLNYNLEERQIINLYINGMTKQDLMKKFHKSFYELGDIIFAFRKSFKDVLLQNEIVEFSFDSENKEFLDYQAYQQGERRKELKKGLVEGRDIKIVQLVKSLPQVSVSELLGLSISDLQDIIGHKKGASKFWLFQIQKLRKTFFPEYSFEELFEVV